VEALLRIENKSLDSNPALRSAVWRTASQLGTAPELVPLAAAFGISGLESNLVAVACENADTPEASQAVRLVLENHGEGAIRGVLFPEQSNSVLLLKALTASSDPRCVPLVAPVILDSGRPVETVQWAVRAQAATLAGTSNLVVLLQNGALSPGARTAIIAELASSRWPEFRGHATAGGGDAAPRSSLPPMASLVAMRGDAARGSEVFQRPQVACATCHQVGNDGVDFGPKLTGIGAKLGREGLLTAILEPSAGIAFGFEAWRITLQDGEEWIGLIASETDDEVLMKLSGGAMQPVRKDRIASRERLPASLMPSGLHESLSTGEFVDLIEYLLSLRPPGTP